MKESKLINILKTFTQTELKTFEKFIVSPYFSIGRDVSGLFSALKKHYPEFDSEALEKENLYKKLFPMEIYNELKLKNLVSGLTNLAEQFLVHNSLKSDKDEFNKLLVKSYKNKDNDKLFLTSLKSLEDNFSKEMLVSTENFDEEKKILKLKEEFYISKNKFDKSVPLRVSQAEYSSASFIIYFIKRLKDKIILPLFYNIPFENSLVDGLSESIDFEKMLRALESKNYPMLWLIEIYYNIYKSILHHNLAESETYYEKSKNLFFENINKFSQKEKCYILDSFTTYCVMRDPFDRKFTRECFEVYKKMLEEKAYYTNDEKQISTTVYGNIMLWALDVSEYDWLEMFIEKYSSELKDEHRDNMKNFANANLYFEKGDYEKALVHISKVQHDFLLYKIQVRNLKFKVFYELNLFDQAFSLIDSYKHFLTENDEIHEIFKLRAHDFIGLCSKLLKAKATNNFSEIDFIKENIKTMQAYELSPWMTAKADELIKNGS